jgi:GNAT superfamily N-acetyltransferase
VTIRLATTADVDELVAMRREFTFEDADLDPSRERPGFERECRAFLTTALAGDGWQLWVAEVDGRLVAHAFIALVERVPRPVRQRARIAYLTNVYTRPGFRGAGIGGRVLQRAQQAARDAGVELMLVWPSDESIPFYARHGFGAEDEPLVWRAHR